MSLGKQAKVLSKKQIAMVAEYLGCRRCGLRNQAVFLLSVKAGLRAKEIASLKWAMVMNSAGEISDTIHLTNEASKGNSGRIVAMNADVRAALIALFDDTLARSSALSDEDHISDTFVVRTERADYTSAQVIVNMFAGWYRDLGLVGCSSHSGRRTFITETAKKISTVGGSLRDVQVMAGHKSLNTTQRYIDYDTEAQRRVVNLL
jgi:integrase/recombinase XerD